MSDQEKLTDREVEVYVRPDPARINAAMRQLTQEVTARFRLLAPHINASIRAVGDAVRRAVPVLNELAVAAAKEQHGPNNWVDVGEDRWLWQSDMCAGWLHDNCPLPEHCDCTCHGGVLR